MQAQAGEVYTVYNQYLKRYTACQVAYIAPPDTVSEEPWAVVLSLDWVGDAPLTAEELLRCFVWQQSRAKRQNLILLYSTMVACCCMICTMKQSSRSMQIGMRI